MHDHQRLVSARCARSLLPLFAVLLENAQRLIFIVECCWRMLWRVAFGRLCWLRINWFRFAVAADRRRRCCCCFSALKVLIMKCLESIMMTRNQHAELNYSTRPTITTAAAIDKKTTLCCLFVNEEKLSRWFDYIVQLPVVIRNDE